MSGKMVQNHDLFDKFNTEAMQAPPLLNPYRMSYHEEPVVTSTVSIINNYQTKHSASPSLFPAPEHHLTVVNE